MVLRTVATVFSAARVGYGSGLVVAPGLFARLWIGRGARDPSTQLMARGLGIRDVVLGGGGLLAMRRSDIGRVRWWFAAQAVSDTVDGFATLAARSALPQTARRALAAGAFASGALAAAVAVTEPEPEPRLEVFSRQPEPPAATGQSGSNQAM